MKTRLISLFIVLSLFILGSVNSSFAKNKIPKKTNHKTMMVDSAKAKTHKIKLAKATHKTHKMTPKSKSAPKPEADKTGTK